MAVCYNANRHINSFCLRLIRYFRRFSVIFIHDSRHGGTSETTDSVSVSWKSHPSMVLIEPPPLLETVAGREYHCHSDCHRHTGGNPILAEGFLAGSGKPGVMAYPAAVARAFAHRNWCTWWMGIWFSRCMEGRVTLSHPYYNIQGPKANLFFWKLWKNFL